VIPVTPDGELSMNTHQELTREYVETEVQADARFVASPAV
jgi:hypothetical protein